MTSVIYYTIVIPLTLAAKLLANIASFIYKTLVQWQRQ